MSNRGMWVALLAGACAAVAPPAAWAARGPCVPGRAQPVCSFTSARVTFTADGDTIRVRAPGRRAVKTIRFTGINAMELHRYSKYRSRRRGDCHGVQATNLIERYIRRAHGRVLLADQRDDSRSGERLRRSVWVRSGGRRLDLAKLELQKALVLWLPNGVEWAHNDEYRRLAAQAAAAQRGLYDPDSCGAGPDADARLRLLVNWDADGDDERNLDGEWVQIVNDGARAVPLDGWWLRDSWLNYTRGPHGRVPGYPFPDTAAVPAAGDLTVHVGCGRNTAADLYWCQDSAAFENVTTDGRALGDGAYLFDPQGDLRVSSMYPCVLSCGDPAQGRVALGAQPSGHEALSVTNTGPGPLSLFGYALKVHHPGVADSYIASYAFGRDAVLAAGETLRLDLEASPAGDTRLARGWPIGPRILRDREGAVSLRTFTDIVVACHAWGAVRC